MPSKLFASVGLGQKGTYTAHMLMYGAPSLMLFERFIFSDWGYLTSLMALVILDSATGGLASIIDRQFSMVIMYKKLGKKLFGIVIAILCIGILKNATVGGEQNIMSGFIDAGLYAVMLGFEGASVLKNAYKIYPWEPIKIMLSKLEIYYDKKANKVTDEINK
jgi:phage-related holin